MQHQSLIQFVNEKLLLKIHYVCRADFVNNSYNN